MAWSIALAIAAIGGTMLTLANPLGAIGMAGVGHLDQHRVDHPQVGGRRHPAVEEPGVIEPAVLVVDVFPVERPVDPLDDPALDLALDIGGWIAQPTPWAATKRRLVTLRGLEVDLDIAELGRKAGRHAAGIHRGCRCDRAAGQRFFGRDLLQRDRRKIADIADSITLLHITRKG